MNHLRCFLLFATVWAVGQTAQLSRLPNDPEALVRSLYQQVVARHPTGLPRGADMKILSPYLSQQLLHRMDLADDCARDWVRQDQERMLSKDQVPEKTPFGWAESGLFSGASERTEPDVFLIERTEAEKDGSIRVYVKFTLSSPPSETWEVATVLVRENGHSVVDDVIYMTANSDPADVWLSKILSDGCDGPRWVGSGHRRTNTK
jgi:hypothetical protein